MQHLTILTRPEEAYKCPILDFTEPIAQNCFRSVCDLNAFVSALISIGSPNFVPVPCASMYDISSTLSSDFSTVSIINAAWASGLGAESPTECPS
ncbi:hypothetical protein D3C78_1554540 [compost metagenome]